LETIRNKPAKMDAELILSNLMDGLYITDRDRQITYWSPSAERITGWSSADVVGKSCKDQVLCHIDKDGHLLCGKEYCPLHRSIVTGQQTAVPIIVYGKTKDGRRLPMHVSVSPLLNSEGDVVGGVEIFRDLSARMPELDRAKAMQLTALVNEVRPDPRYRLQTRYVPMDVVGGDFYAMESLDEDHIAIFQTDVMGHGVSAALYTMFFRLLWTELHNLLTSPAEFLAAVDRHVHPLTKDNTYFATGVALLIDLAKGEIRYAGAGHPAPMIFRAGGAVDALGCEGIPLGLLGQGSYAEQRADFGPGDSLLVYTDGATEIHDLAGQELGSAGLQGIVKRHIRPSGLLDITAIEEALLIHSNAIRMEDDMTFIWLARSASG
jgi:sigma-B regulation protein RsbU (phosphoserine phosphatase)